MIAIIIGIALISLANAVEYNITAGECFQVDLDESVDLDNLEYEITENTHNLEGLSVEIDGAVANVCTVINYVPDSFTITFYNEKGEVVGSGSSGGNSDGGGGGGASYYPSFKCEEWSECVEGSQTQVCHEIRGRQADIIKTRQCSESNSNNEISSENTEISESQNRGLGGFTVRVIDGVGNFTKTKGGTFAFFIIGIAGLFVVVIFIRKRHNKK